MSNEDEEKNVQAREKVVEPPLVDRVEGQDGHPLDTPPVLAVDNPDGQGGQGDGQPRTTSKDRMDNLDGQDGQPPLSRMDNPLPVAEARPLTGKNRTRWREDYRAVFGEVDELFEARVSRAMRLMENGAVRSRKEALEQIRDLPPEPNSQEEPGGKTAPVGSDVQPNVDTETSPASSSEENRSRLKWIEAYRTVFGEEPNGQLAEARMRAAMNFYDPERSVGRRQALEAVRASEEEAASRTREAERVFEPDNHAPDEEPEGEWLPLPSEDALTLGAALMKIGRLEAEVEELRRAVARLEAGLHRTETRLGGMAPGLRALREAAREARDLALKVSHRVDTLAPASSSEDKSLPPGKKVDSLRGRQTPVHLRELRELRARMDEERGRILLEVENRLEEAEELMRRSTEARIAALESWVRRVSRYLGIGKKGGLFGR